MKKLLRDGNVTSVKVGKVDNWCFKLIMVWGNRNYFKFLFICKNIRKKRISTGVNSWEANGAHFGSTFTRLERKCPQSRRGETGASFRIREAHLDVRHDTDERSGLCKLLSTYLLSLLSECRMFELCWFHNHARCIHYPKKYINIKCFHHTAH